MSINEQLAPLTNEEHLKRTEIIREALTWTGTGFRHGAQLKGIAAECGSFIIAVYAKFGFAPSYKLPEHPEQWAIHKDSPTFDAEFYIREMKRFCTELSHGFPLPADVALFWWGHAYSHGAIVIDWPHELIHCAPGSSKSAGVQLVNAEIDPFLRRHAGNHPPRFFNPFLGASL